MWWIRVLSGQQAGQKFQLKEGSNVIGRAPNCDIKLASNSISKEHLKIEVYGDKVILTDLGSRNGTFINGIKISNKKLDDSDKVSLHTILIDIINVPDNFTQVQPSPHSNKNSQQSQASPIQHRPFQGPQSGGYSAHNMAGAEAPAYNNMSMPQNNYDPSQFTDNPPPQHMGSSESIAAPQKLADFGNIINNYFENVVMPGIYKIPTLMDFKWALGLFIAGFILFVTAFSTVPLMRILRSSIEKESQRRALTIARTLALINQSGVAQGSHSTLTTTMAMNEPGVKEAYLINGLDGSIIAPAKRIGSYPEDPYVHEARLRGKEGASQIDSNTIAAVVPIRIYNPSTGKQSNYAFSVVIYNMGTLAVNDERTLSLFIQTFFIALFVGLILFFFFYKMIDHPIKSLNRQLDKALKEGRSDISNKYIYNNLQLLISNINSALSRSQNPSDDISAEGPSFEMDRSQEMENLTHMVGFACIAIKGNDHTIAALNSAFEEKSSLSSADLLYKTTDSILDQALKLSIEDLLQRCSISPQQSHSNQLDIGGEEHEITIQAVMGTNEVNYYLISIVPGYGGYEE